MTIMSYQQQQNDFGGAAQQGAGSLHTLGCSSNKLLVSSATIASTSDEVIKSQFQTREGTYKLMTLSEFSRPSRVPLNPHQGQNVACNAPVRVSFVSLPESDDLNVTRDHICFNVGRELYVYSYGGVSEITDLSRPIDKRVYKGTFPTCHDFNQCGSTSESCSLLVGFSAGQIQLIDPFRKDGQQINKLFNEERLIDKSRVTCVRWIPGSPNQFLVSHSSGCMYVYNEELASGPTAPAYQLFKQGDGFSIHTCKTKSSRNPVYRWTVGEESVNEFAFSPDGRLLATVGQDGFLRIFNYHAMECVGIMRSYFGGILCVAWSPDMRYVAAGGEDDLISVYSLMEKRLVCRCQGHKSWVSQVAFDPYTTLMHGASDTHLVDSEEDLRSLNISSAAECGGPSSSTAAHFQQQAHHRLSSSFRSSSNAGLIQKRIQKDSINSSISSMTCLSYRLGSVGHDTLLCLWDLTEDILKPITTGRVRTSAIFLHSPINSVPNFAGGSKSKQHDDALQLTNGSSSGGGGPTTAHNFKESGLKFKRHFMGFRGLGGGGGDKQHQSTVNAQGASKNDTSLNYSASNCTTNNNNTTSTSPLSLASSRNSAKLLGTPLCPHLNETPMLEPLVSKKISHERLTVLVFREDCIVTACQEGFICTWARPGRLGGIGAAGPTQPTAPAHSINSPNPGGSPHTLPGGTVV